MGAAYAFSDHSDEKKQSPLPSDMIARFGARGAVWQTRHESARGIAWLHKRSPVRRKQFKKKDVMQNIDSQNVTSAKMPRLLLPLPKVEETRQAHML
jgi:hypothetical protein